MLKNKYFKVTKNENDKPYAYYQFGIDWIPKDFINDKITEGYIVQKVIIKNNTGIKEIIEDFPDGIIEYYEAWKIENSIYINHKENASDDVFSFGNSIDKLQTIALSIGKNGTVEYDTKIYWINKKNKFYPNVESWKYEVKQANGLKSRLLKNCSELIDDEPILKREKFVHNVNFIDELIIENSIIDFFKEKIKNKDNTLCELLRKELPNNDICNKIIEKIEKMIDSGNDYYC